PPRCHCTYVVKSGPRFTGDHAHNAWIAWQGTFVCRISEPFGAQSLLQFLKGLKESPSPRWTSHFRDPSKSASRWIEASLSTKLHPRSLAQTAPKAHRLALVHHAVYRRVPSLILEGEIQMTALGAGQSSYLTFNPHPCCGALDGPLEPLGQLKNGENSLDFD